MKDISIKDLIDLVVSEAPQAEVRIQQMFDWHFQRNMMIAKWIMGAVASLVIAALGRFSGRPLEYWLTADWDLGGVPQIIRFSDRLMETYILRGIIQTHADNISATFDNKDGIYPEPIFEKAKRYRGCLYLGKWVVYDCDITVYYIASLL